MGNLAVQEQVREEILNGRIVSMSPRPVTNHNKIVINIATIFNNYLY